MCKLNSYSVSYDGLYGKTVNNEWKDGMLTRCMREMQNMDQQCWIIFDNPIDALWVEAINALLDDNKVLHVPNG